MSELFENRPIIPVIEILNVDDAKPLAEALLKGGIDVIEITFRTEAGAEAIDQIGKSFPEMLLGAGTVVTQDQARRAIDLGVDFAVAPGLNPRTVDFFRKNNVLILPGVQTPSEIERGLELGCSFLKFFPAGAAGGVGMLKALSGPYASLGVKFCPTGGIGLDNMMDYLALATVQSVGGSWVATKKQIADGDWSTITQQCADAIARAKDG